MFIHKAFVPECLQQFIHSCEKKKKNTDDNRKMNAKSNSTTKGTNYKDIRMPNSPSLPGTEVLKQAQSQENKGSCTLKALCLW